MRMQSVGPEIWRETLKNVENEKCTLQDMEYVKKSWKVRNAHCRTWIMVSNTEKHEKWKKHTRTWLWQAN